RHPLRGHVHEVAEDQGEDRGEPYRLEHGPARAEERLLVADLELLLRQEVEELAELPQLAQRARPTPAFRADADAVLSVRHMTSGDCPPARASPRPGGSASSSAGRPS